MLLVAEREEPDEEQKRLIVAAIGTGCREFCCLGRYADRLHDYVDYLLEDQGLTDVVTTAHENEPLDDALYYFLNLAAGKPATIVAVVASNPGVALGLRRAVAAM